MDEAQRNNLYYIIEKMVDENYDLERVEGARKVKEARNLSAMKTWREATIKEQEAYFRPMITSKCKKTLPKSLLLGKVAGETLIDVTMDTLPDCIDHAENEQEVIDMFMHNIIDHIDAELL